MGHEYSDRITLDVLDKRGERVQYDLTISGREPVKLIKTPIAIAGLLKDLASKLESQHSKTCVIMHELAEAGYDVVKR